MDLQSLTKECHYVAKEKGWWDEPRTFGDVIALCHSELSEALESFRESGDPRAVSYPKGEKPEGVPIELADLIIRVLDYCGKENIDIAHAIYLKMEYNFTRPHRHGGKKL